MDIAHDRLIAARFAAFTLEGSPLLEQGRTLMDRAACRRCHVSAKKGNGLAANLDWSPRNATPEELFLAIREPALFMPDFHFEDRQLVALVNTILAGSRDAGMPVEEVPVQVHFEEAEGPESLFHKSCGSCHRMLTGRQGGLGVGHIGPDLSGLFTDFYPKSYPDEKAWTVQGLEKWLKNPRQVVNNARMAPVLLKTDEWQRLQIDIHDREQGEPAPSDGTADNNHASGL